MTPSLETIKIYDDSKQSHLDSKLELNKNSRIVVALQDNVQLFCGLKIVDIQLIKNDINIGQFFQNCFTFDDIFFSIPNIVKVPSIVQQLKAVSPLFTKLLEYPGSNIATCFFAAFFMQNIALPCYQAIYIPPRVSFYHYFGKAVEVIDRLSSTLSSFNSDDNYTIFSPICNSVSKIYKHLNCFMIIYRIEPDSVYTFPSNFDLDHIPKSVFNLYHTVVDNPISVTTHQSVSVKNEKASFKTNKMMKSIINSNTASTVTFFITYI